MKKFFYALWIAMACLAVSVPAHAYSEEMAQLADLLNQQAGDDQDIREVSYDGSSLILTMNVERNGDLYEMISSATPNEVKEYMLPGFKASLTQEVCELLATYLMTYDANLIIRIPRDANKPFDMVITPEDLSN